MPDKYEKDMTLLMKAAAEVKVSSKKLKRYVITWHKVDYALIDVTLSNITYKETMLSEATIDQATCLCVRERWI